LSSIAPIPGGAGLGSLISIAMKYIGLIGKYVEICKKTLCPGLQRSLPKFLKSFYFINHGLILIILSQPKSLLMAGIIY
ncbi:MAG: hypothetical protein ACLQLE_02490, partial [Desulfobaccales bacterium]